MPYWQLRLEQLEGFLLAILYSIMSALLPASAAPITARKKRFAMSQKLKKAFII